jgi:hypothetical protein
VFTWYALSLMLITTGGSWSRSLSAARRRARRGRLLVGAGYAGAALLGCRKRPSDSSDSGVGARMVIIVPAG